MITPSQATQQILEHVHSYGTETVILSDACGRVLAEDIRADRDIPPYNRVTMDGIAIRFADFAQGTRQFSILAVQAAGNIPIAETPNGTCVQIMTGAAMPDSFDTIIPIEELILSNGKATVSNEATPTAGQFLHRQGADKQAGDVLVPAGHLVKPADIPIVATVGLEQLTVSKLPRTVIITTGDELVDITAKPSPYQVRRSNNYGIQAVLSQYGIQADMLHLPDDQESLRIKLKLCLEKYELVIISGGVSKGAFDFIPGVLTDLSVQMHFHGVAQRPGKPFWFGTSNTGTTVFALPGNPVSTFMCVHKYVLPWLLTGLGASQRPDAYAILERDVDFPSSLDYFLQVSLQTNEDGQLIATPLDNNGSGDFVNLSEADAFIELSGEQTVFKKGEAHKIILL